MLITLSEPKNRQNPYLHKPMQLAYVKSFALQLKTVNRL